MTSRFIIVAICTLAVLAQGSSATALNVTKQELLTTATIYNFLRFSRPIGNAFNEGVLTLCIDGDAPLAAALTTLAGKPVQDRTIEVELTMPADFGRCDAVYTTEAQADPEALDRLAERGVLTIGATDGFIDRGGAVGILDVGGRVRFEVSLATVGRTRFSPSSRLLRLAHRVER